MSEIVLRVRKRGEIYTTKGLRAMVGIKEGGRVRARVEDGKVIIEPILTVDEIIRGPVVRLSPEEAEKLSEEAQREEGIHG